MTASTTPVVLSAQGLVKRFGGITATGNVTLNLHQGARHALIGPNGAGKTTLINLLTGVLEPTEGQIFLNGEDITHLAPHQRVRRGMVRTFQINQLFASMTPLETLALVISQHRGLGRRFWKAPSPWPASRAYCCWTNRWRAYPQASVKKFWTPSRPCLPMSRCC